MPDCGELDAPGLVDPTSVPNRRNARTVGRAIIVRRPWARGESSALFAAQCVLQSANRILHLASSLVGLAFSFQLLIAEDLAGGFLYGSLNLLCRTFDSILIHVVCSLFVRYFCYASWREGPIALRRRHDRGECAPVARRSGDRKST